MIRPYISELMFHQNLENTTVDRKQQSEIGTGAIHVASMLRARIMTIAHTVTMAIEIAMWSFLALASPTAIDAETPHTPQ